MVNVNVPNAGHNIAFMGLGTLHRMRVSFDSRVKSAADAKVGQGLHVEKHDDGINQCAGAGKNQKSAPSHERCEQKITEF